MYKCFVKRVFDIVCSFFALAVLSPAFLVLTVAGAVMMNGNPFFTQKRPGKNEKIFNLIKFRTMTNKTDKNGNLLPDDKRLTKYGKFLRKTSLDELPELINILSGSMSVVGPRPLLVKYLPLYSERQRLRHGVRPGLTGYAQAHGRNALSWEDRLAMDVWYTEKMSLKLDIKIIFDTVKSVLKRDGIHSETSETMEEFTGSDENAKITWEAPA